MIRTPWFAALLLAAFAATAPAQIHPGFIVRSQSQAFEHGSCDEFDCVPRQGTFASPDSIVFRVYGEQNSPYVIAMSTTMACTPIPGFANSLGIDPTIAVPVAAGVLRVSGFNLCWRAEAITQLAVPSGVPGGISVAFQGLAIATPGGAPAFTRTVVMTRPSLPTM